ncbi:glutamyl-tRNA reductase [Cellulomonas taurus]|uniref:glutamyl-tRNA reductase n=1 Tax=Cellulomonas taurus TaxID=2729175 RepID=UPI00145F0FEB|nr:glutamyl-tRNA reductase [Cellulomonas taurus]
MVLLSLAASHQDLDLSVLERLSADAHAVGREVVSGLAPISGAVVLATCNRFELYLDVDDTADPESVDVAAAAAMSVVAERSGYPAQRVSDALTPVTGTAVAEHLFAVASGLESMVVGEREIAGQVRRALTTARRDGTTTSGLEGLFQAASRTSRAVGAHTGLGAAGRSVVGVALDLVEAALPDWSQVRCLLIGTGSYAGASLAAVKARGCTDITVYSASGRAGRFAADRGVDAATSDLAGALAGIDLVVACSGAAGSLLDADTVRRGTGGPLAVVDLALQHDVDPEVGTLPGVTLVGLATVAEHAPGDTSATVADARRIVAEEVHTFESELRTREWDPPVVAERRRVMAELARVSAQLSPRSARSLRRRVRTAMHKPTVRARTAARVGDTASYAAGLAELAAIDVPALVSGAGAGAAALG